ncbi:hypothetical protein ABIB57_004308 [Devosia sp. UYZn731]
MSVRKRTWTTNGTKHPALQADYLDGNGERPRKQFALKKDAEAFEKRAAAEVPDGILSVVAKHERLCIGLPWMRNGRRSPTRSAGWRSGNTCLKSRPTTVLHTRRLPPDTPNCAIDLRRQTGDLHPGPRHRGNNTGTVKRVGGLAYPTQRRRKWTIQITFA